MLTLVLFQWFHQQAAIHLNNVDNLIIEDCTINGNRKDVPIVGTFSASIFIRYVKLLNVQLFREDFPKIVYIVIMHIGIY